MKIILALVLTMLGLAAPSFGGSAAHAAPMAGSTFSDPAIEMRARNLQRQLRCLVCQGESIDESRSDFAADMRRLVREQIAAGKSDRQIQDFLVARYGDFILMKPPLQPDTYLLWLGPAIVLLGAGGVAALAVRRARRRLAADEHQENI